MEIAQHVPLGPLTTLELGGTARYFAEAHEERDVVEAMRAARELGASLRVIGGGSNLIVADEGVDALVLAMRSRGVAFESAGDRERVIAAAGEPWDALVAATIDAGLTGLECLSGIPGLVGATPIQNVGAYGVEIGDVLERVRVIDRSTAAIRDLSPAECGLSYRDSALKRDPDRFVVLGVAMLLARDARPVVRYEELSRALESRGEITAKDVREVVIGLRRKKSMVIDPSDENRRSVGSFFTNPVVSQADATRLVDLLLERGAIATPGEVPMYMQRNGLVKVAAAFLIERAGVHKGLRRGAVGVSSKHALSLVHLGGGTTRELLALADHVRERVSESFGILLEREPILWSATGEVTW